MTPEAFKAARRRLGLTQRGLARILGVNHVTVQRWEAPETNANARPPNPIACTALAWMARPGRPADWPDPPTNR
jgi:DNA-binding transcriptional regulator YiaG